jgi:hypothetical protein
MYLDEIPIYTIILIGHWSSNTFLVPQIHQKTSQHIHVQHSQEDAQTSRIPSLTSCGLIHTTSDSIHEGVGGRCHHRQWRCQDLCDGARDV